MSSTRRAVLAVGAAVRMETMWRVWGSRPAALVD
jgi:hypothetical protein